MQILAISGSLRAASTNTALLHAEASLAPENIELILYDGLGDLPQFNPDFAHGVPGVLKNALDWLVASGELYGKPVALFAASPRGTSDGNP